MMRELGKAKGLELTWNNVSYLRGDSSRPEHSADSKGKGVSDGEECVSDAVVRAILEVMPSLPAGELEKIEKFLNS